ncbi:head GIN domain-containing protein [Lutibacter sp.]|uniref:head GIN domain-containing protein n=1 Tax=Lutibacter sp. TaxID=1925666 RepID=UPI0034A013A8
MNFLKTIKRNVSISKIVITMVSLFFVSTTINAQYFQKKVKGNREITTITRTTSDYNEIGVGGDFEVTLVNGKEGEITIKADENLLEYIETEVKKGNLSIKTKKGYQLRSKHKIEITIPFNDIQGVSLAGSGNVYSNDEIKSNELKLSLAGSGNMDLKVSAKNSDTNIAGSGNITLNGDTDEFTCSIAGSGNLNGYNLKTSIANVKIAGSGNVNIDISNEVHAKISGSGNVIYTGNPEIVKSKSVGSGSVKKKN